MRARISRPAMFLSPLLLAASSAWAGPLTVDGNLSDWGVVVADNNGSTFNTSGNIGLLGKMVEDQNDTSNSGNLGPGGGGQNYDAEFMGVAQQGGNLFISIVSGQRPDNGFSTYGPGDIRIDGIKNGQAVTFGIEVGGGQGGVAVNGSLTEGAAGSTYQMSSGGSTTGFLSAAANQVAGSIWKNVTWMNGPVSNDPTQFAINANSVYGGLADYVFTLNSQTTQHSIIELSLNLGLSIFNGVTLTAVHWRPSCGNDELDVCLPTTPPAGPEPASLAIWSIGGLGLLGLRRFRRRSAS